MRYARRFGRSSVLPYPSLVVTHAVRCRVCGVNVPAGARAWRMAWSVEAAHEDCGWFTAHETQAQELTPFEHVMKTCGCGARFYVQVLRGRVGVSKCQFCRERSAAGREA